MVYKKKYIDDSQIVKLLKGKPAIIFTKGVVIEETLYPSGYKGEFYEEEVTTENFIAYTILLAIGIIIGAGLTGFIYFVSSV